MPRGRGKEGGGVCAGCATCGPAATARHGARRARFPRSEPAAQPGGSCAGCATHSPPPCPRLSPLCRVHKRRHRFRMRRRHFCMRRSDVPKRAPQRAPANRGRARGRRLDCGNESASIRIDPLELLRGRRPWARARPSESKVPMLARMRRRCDRSSRVPKKKNAPRGATSLKARNALRTLRFRDTARPRLPDPNPDRQPFVRAFSSSPKRPSPAFSGQPQKNAREP